MVNAMKTSKRSYSRLASNISVRGYSHKKCDKPCQDHSASWATEKYGAAIVCDGHGGDKYIFSADGSKAACELGGKMIKEFMQKVYTKENCLLNHSNYDEMLSRLERAIISAWRDRIESMIEKKSPLESGYFKLLEDKDQRSLEKNPTKAYGTTFIAAVVCDDFCFVLQIGDGNAVLLHSDGTAEIPKELEDDTLQFNLTTSMCNSDAANSFRHCYRDNDNEVKGVALTSDGIINSYPSQEAYLSLIKNAYAAFEEDDEKIAKSELKKALNAISEKGSGDDLSFAIIRAKS